MRVQCRCILCILLLLMAAASFARAETQEWLSPPVEIRAVWMDRQSIPKTEDAIRTLIRSYAKAGINLVHPEVLFYGRTAYPSSYLPQSDLWNGLDILRIIVDEAHRHAMEVHPWVCVFRTGYDKDMGGVLTEHPDWVALNKDGQPATDNKSYWLCPSNPGVRRTLLRAICEIAEKYPVDGVELDYIRFPNQSPIPYCYNDTCRSKFKLECGVDPLEIQPFTKAVVDWQLWREGLINSFVADVSAELRKTRPGINVSAAVGSLPDGARMELLQNWENWAANKWVEFLAPMDYTTDAQSFGRMVKRASDALENRALLAPGIGLYTQKGPSPMLEQIQAARCQAVSGTTFFATAYLNPERLKALEDGPFHEKAELPLRSPARSAEMLSCSAAQRLKRGCPSDLAQADIELQAARNLIAYETYRAQETGFVPPKPPPIFIPDKVTPIPEAPVPLTTTPPAIDGKLDDPVWRTASKLSLDYTALGEEASQPTEVYLAHDDGSLYIAYRCSERGMGDIKAAITERDGPVFLDDSAEVFLDVAGASKDYYHFAVNALGTKFDARGSDSKFNPDWQAAASRETDAWTVEMAIPFSAMKITAPSTGASWRANFCRNRSANAENMCWSPTYGSFHTPIRFGKIVFERGG